MPHAMLRVCKVMHALAEGRYKDALGQHQGCRAVLPSKEQRAVQ